MQRIKSRIQNNGSRAQHYSMLQHCPSSLTASIMSAGSQRSTSSRAKSSKKFKGCKKAAKKDKEPSHSRLSKLSVAYSNVTRPIQQLAPQIQRPRGVELDPSKSADFSSDFYGAKRGPQRNLLLSEGFKSASNATDHYGNQPLSPQQQRPDPNKLALNASFY